MNIKNKTILLVFLLIVLNLGFTTYCLTRDKKIAFVKSQELVYGYKGMKEAQSKYQQQIQEWQANLETLKNDYQKMSDEFKQKVKQITEEEKTSREQTLKLQEDKIIQYSQVINSRIKEEEEKILQGVLNQINSFVENYGKENNYDIIFGTTLSGSILYGDKAIDITDELLHTLNKNYSDE